MKKQKKNQTKTKSRFAWELIPVLFVACILPYILRMEIVVTGLEDMPFLPPAIAQRADFFLFWKSRLFVAATVIMLLVLADYFLMRRKRDMHWKQWIALGIYEMFVVLSAIGSAHRNYSLSGMTEHFETVWVLLGYGVAAYYTYIFLETEEQFRMVTGCMLVSTLGQGILGLFQMAGKDILSFDLIKGLMIPDRYAQFRENIDFRFSVEVYQKVSTTLYNPNYAGVYFAMMLPVAITAALILRGKKRVFAVITAAVSFLCLIGTGSKSAILSFFAVLLIATVLVAIKNKKRWYAGVILVVGMLFIWAGYDKVTGIGTGKRVLESLKITPQKYKLQDIQLKDDEVHIVFDGKMMQVGWEENGEALYLNVRDENGQDMNLVDDEKQRRVTPEDPHFEGLELWCYRRDGIPYLCMEFEGQTWKFTNMTEDGTMRYINLWGKPDRIKKAESILFDGKEEMFTYRGYIWGRTIPLLKKYLFLGSGPDTFLLVFPQNDYVMRANLGFGFFSEILSKPHSMYLQMAVQTGVVSLVAFLVWILSGIVKFMQTWRSCGSDRKSRYTALGCFVAVLVYLLAGIWNDSMIVTAPLFFVLLGMMKKWSILERCN